MQSERKERITKKEFHKRGGFDNAQLFRLQTRGGSWRYYVRVASAADIAKIADNRLPGETMASALQRAGK